ncbi:ubiquinone biosynthesis protein UbiB [Pseudoxanthomonas mexicana]|uniref:Ubiquinone biosynthesis protein UbiB n=1 Tax=Pseudoxanthomonas mexicana TaxID=128785 RepID=A0ABX6RI72_PSEMX|nr:AarF/UbiB family protein [Pseudoxanthomonas mexicana]QLQ30131.1 MAG: ubiquinone biosynthesis protein UbiB [Pseudoxanthomonas sp.]QND82024.1 ubiquinone biosynthesis protein UbiB [Pseudoxanthomonas mexicana]
MWETLGTVRDLGRLQDIASVLIRWGFGDMVKRMGMAGVLEKAGRLLHWQAVEEGRLRMDVPTRLRCTLQDLGPTFVKLGQVLATRVDLLPPAWIDELGKLQNAVPALPWDTVLPQLREDLGAEPEAVFARVEHEPLAAASLAQAHRAWLADGSAVVLKIRRPGIRDTVEADLRLLKHLAVIVEKNLPELRRYHPQRIVQQFSASLRRELDFAAECRNAERIAHNFAGRDDIVIPRVYWQWTCERLNVQECLEGVPGRDLAAVDAMGLDRVQLARTGAGLVLKMVLEDGFFHADPHPGNIFYMPDGAIGVIDFGMVGRVTEQRRFQIVRLLHGLVVHDSAAVAEVLADWTEENNDIDEVRLQESADVFVDQYRGVPLKDLRMGAMLGDVTAMLREHGLSLPADLALMIKAFLTLEGMGRQLDPDFDMASEARPYLERAMLERFAPDVLVRRGRRTLSGLVDLLRDMPRDVHRLLQSARRGKLQMHIEVDTLRAFGEQVDRAANRLTMGIITASLVIGSSIVMNSVGGGVSNRWLMALGVLGFVGAALCGVWILFSIWRSGRR